jgi:hypothetical protein
VPSVGPGNSLFIKRSIARGFKNDGPDPAAYLSIMTPAVLGTAYFRELAALLSTGGPPDVEKLKEIMRHAMAWFPSCRHDTSRSAELPVMPMTTRKRIHELKEPPSSAMTVSGHKWAQCESFANVSFVKQDGIWR